MIREMPTQRDLEIMELGKEVLKKIKTKKEWKEFVRYMQVYFEESMNFEDYKKKP